MWRLAWMMGGLVVFQQGSSVAPDIHLFGNDWEGKRENTNDKKAREEKFRRTGSEGEKTTEGHATNEFSCVFFSQPNHQRVDDERRWRGNTALLSKGLGILAFSLFLLLVIEGFFSSFFVLFFLWLWLYGKTPPFCSSSKYR